MAAKAKLRAGMIEMLDHYEEERKAKAALAGFKESKQDREIARIRIECRDELIAEIASSELSEIAMWVVSEALETIFCDDRTWESRRKLYHDH
jgi:hypothetical protein